MVIDMNDAKLVTLEQLRGFLAGTADLHLTPPADPAARYAFIKAVLKRFKYPLQNRAHRGLIRRYLQRVTGYSRPQLTRLIAQYLRSGRLVQRYRALLEVQLKRHQPIGAYAAELSVTPDHLSRVCRTVTGLSALDLLHDRLVLEGRRLLAYTDAPVSEVARELGFDDPAYFSRFFARRAGLAPQAYRVALQQGGAVPP